MPKSLYETVCAFLNQDGGEIYLGVDDNGRTIGLPSKVINQMITIIATTLNNSDKLDPPFLLYPQEVERDGLSVLRLQVPQSSRIHRLNGVVYDRSAEGDFKVRDPELIARMVAKKNAYYSELKTILNLESGI